jgi:hypothetical protein
MGFLDTILGMFGIGQPKVSLTLERTSAGRGAILAGSVTVEGGRRPLPVTAFNAKLVRAKKVKTEQGTSTERDTLREETAPQGGQEIAPGGTMKWSFVLQIPADTPPSGDDISYEVEASLDCPGWDPSSEVKVTVTPDIDSAAGEDLSSHYVLPERRYFRHSSVHGDFRVLLCDGGFVTTWKTEISVRNADGSQRCRIPGWGKSMAVSPDGKRLVASDASKRVAMFDLSNGEMIGDAIHPGDWIFDVLWLPGGVVLAAASDCIHVYDESGEEKASIRQIDGADFYCGGLAASPRGFYMTDSNGRRVVECDTSGSVLAKSEVRSPSAIFVGTSGKISVECHERVAVLDGALSSVKRWELPGKKGTRFAGQDQGSYTHWKAMPKLSPDGETLLVQDGSGQLWQCNADSGEGVRVFARDVVDFVEDTEWVDAQHFLAVLNDGTVKKIGLDGSVKFAQKDME